MSRGLTFATCTGSGGHHGLITARNHAAIKILSSATPATIRQLRIVRCYIGGILQTLTGDHWKIHVADVMEGLAAIPSGSVHCVVTSPPYWGLRDYGFDGQFGSEKTPQEFVAKMVEVFQGVKRVLRDDGVLFMNLGDSYATGGGAVGRAPGGGSQGERFIRAGMINTQANRMNFGLSAGNAIGVPWRVAFGLQDDGWILRSEIIWAKPSPMPESVSGWRWKDGRLAIGSWRPTKSHEQIFMFAKTSRYFCDGDGSKEQATGIPSGNKKRMWGNNDTTDRRNGTGSVERHGNIPHGGSETRNMRSVWRISPESYKEAHFATYPTELVRRCLIAGTSRGGCCSDCGRQFAPVVESKRTATRPGTNSKVNRASDDENSPYEQHGGSVVGNRDPQRHTTTTIVTGYLPTCKCGADKSRPVVLDPFSGSATTGQVAINMGCDYIGIEANPEYADLGVERLETPWIPVAERKKPRGKRRRRVASQKELF